MAEQKTKEVEKEFAFDKKSIVDSKTFKKYRDLLGAILEDEKAYTHKQVNDLLEKELKRKVVY